MCHRTGQPDERFPRYDEAAQIDSAAVVPDHIKQYGEPRVDPKSTAYTEMYCKKDKN